MSNIQKFAAHSKCLPRGEGGLAKRGRMRVGEHFRASVQSRWCFKTLISLLHFVPQPASPEGKP